MTNRLSFLRALFVLWFFRKRLIEGVRHDVKQRYAGSVLGVAWAALYPLLLLSLYSVIYVFIFKVRPQSLGTNDYVVLVFSGLVPLLAFNESLVMSAGSLVANRTLLLNTVFPAELIPLRAAMAAQVPALFAQAVTLVAGAALGLTSWRAIIAVPVLWILMFMFVCGLGWILSLLTLVIRDIQQALGLILMALTMLSPFAYTPDMVPEKFKLLLYFNPMSYYVLSFQRVVVYGQWPALSTFVPVICISLLAFFGGYALFNRSKFVFFDYV